MRQENLTVLYDKQENPIGCWHRNKAGDWIFYIMDKAAIDDIEDRLKSYCGDVMEENLIIQTGGNFVEVKEGIGG